MVFVDDMRAHYRWMIMCHMLSDGDDSELHAMADKIGVSRRHHQAKGTPKSHYDICLEKRALAIRHGAKEISKRDSVLLVKKKREMKGRVFNDG